MFMIRFFTSSVTGGMPSTLHIAHASHMANVVGPEDRLVEPECLGRISIEIQVFADFRHRRLLVIGLCHRLRAGVDM